VAIGECWIETPIRLREFTASIIISGCFEKKKGRSIDVIDRPYGRTFKQKWNGVC
jgi:hypothetical protein